MKVERGGGEVGVENKEGGTGMGGGTKGGERGGEGRRTLLYTALKDGPQCRGSQRQHPHQSSRRPVGIFP